jgi:hypothetical protein
VGQTCWYVTGTLLLDRGGTLSDGVQAEAETEVENTGNSGGSSPSPGTHRGSPTGRGSLNPS